MSVGGDPSESRSEKNQTILTVLDSGPQTPYYPLMMEVMGHFRPDDVLPHVTQKRVRRDYTGDDGRIWSVRMNSHRYFCFSRSLSCAVCGIIGNTMVLERDVGSRTNPHFNLYAGAGDDKILMTKDHIRPKSCGGRNDQNNYQTMCTICNGLKGSRQLDLNSLTALRTMYDSRLLSGVSQKKASRAANVLANKMARDKLILVTAREFCESLADLHPDTVLAIRDCDGSCDPATKFMIIKKNDMDAPELPDDFCVIG